jgi:CheY-like chemotaxis protein
VSGCYCQINFDPEWFLKMRPIALVVDDSMLIRHAVCSYFEDRGFEAESACNGLEALEVVARTRPDIIVTDIQMPKLDGRRLIEALKTNPKTADVPILVLANRRFVEESRADKLADHFIFKDIDIEGQLNQALRLMLPDHLVER